ncbi:MAG: N-acetylglucosamine-6-phosphate deacetylase [Acidimicrobiales bacterium]
MTVVAEGRLVGSGRTVQVGMSGGRVTSVVEAPGGARCWVAPGFVDLQVNGYGGLDFNSDNLDADQVTELVARQWGQGVTSFCPTLVSASEERITSALAVIAEARRTDPLVRHAIPCVHVEGPYLSAEDGPRGAHNVAALRPPDLAELERWQRAGDGLVGIVTLAPELPGAVPYVRAASSAGVIVALGHTAANAEQIVVAVDAGARLSTHLGNGCHVMVPRHPNHLWAQLSEDRLQASFIADGHHLPAATLTAMVRAKGVDRSVLVSDSVALAGSAPGNYGDVSIGQDVTLSHDGRLSLTGTSMLAGSVRSLPDCLAWVVTHTDVGLTAATRMASANPSRLLGLADRGEVRVGASADLTIFELDEKTEEFRLEATVVAGHLVGRGKGAVPVVEG